MTVATLRVVVTEGGRPVSSLTFGQARVTIGAAPASDIVLANPCVSWHHATLHVSGSRLVLVDAGSTNGSFVNGVRVGRADLGAGGHVFIHPFDLAVGLDKDAAAADPASRETPAGAAVSGRLTVVNGPGSLTSRSFLLPASRRLVIGRLASSDIPLRDPTVSREHAELQSNGNGRWTIRDLGSRNGIAVNGRVTPAAELADGDRIDIGPLISLIFSEGLVSDHERPATRHFKQPAPPAPGSRPLDPPAAPGPAAPLEARPAPRVFDWRSRPPEPAGSGPGPRQAAASRPELLEEDRSEADGLEPARRGQDGGDHPPPAEPDQDGGARAGAFEPPTAVARPRLRLRTSRAPADSRIAVIDVEGAVDGDTCPELEQSLARAVEAGERFLVIDLAGCNRLDHAGLGVLVVACGQLRRMGGELRLCAADPDLADALGLGGDEDVLRIAADRDTATDDLRRGLSQV
jgi:anti-anti-sigma factor